MKQMIGGRLAPITYTIGFLGCEPELAINKYLEWQEPLQRQRNVSFACSRCMGSLDETLRSLLPLTSVERRRFLFMPTLGNWTAFLDNGYQGADVFPPLSYLAQILKCKA